MSTQSTSLPSLDEALSQCRRQQESWALQPVRQRLRPVHALRRLLVQECAALCTAVKPDIDKSAEEVLAGELLPLADGCRFLEREAARLLRPRRVSRRPRPLYLWGQADTVQR